MGLIISRRTTLKFLEKHFHCFCITSQRWTDGCPYAVVEFVFRSKNQKQFVRNNYGQASKSSYQPLLRIKQSKNNLGKSDLYFLTMSGCGRKKFVAMKPLSDAMASDEVPHSPLGRAGAPSGSNSASVQ